MSSSLFRKDLLLDLMDWQTLYTAGRLASKSIFNKKGKFCLLYSVHCDRLHKPVNILDKREDDLELEEALRSNLTSALHAALLLLPGVLHLAQPSD